jgi:phosphoglucomutase
MGYLEEYQKWIDSKSLSGDERAELDSIRNDPKEIESRFFAPLEFGTAGLRGIIGAGLYRMNVHVVRWATQAFANLIIHEGRDAVQKGVAICYDCRNFSEEFAREAACVLAGNGINVKLFDALRPTPELSFAIREYECTAGINITASHNPKEYNGYKVYWSDGAQLPPQHAEMMAHEMEKIDIFRGIIKMPFDEAVKSGKITMLGESTDKVFLDMVLCQSVQQDTVKKHADTFKLVFTPFHGTGYKLIPDALRRLGLKHVLCVPEQMVIDGNFPTVKSPNPENPEGFALAIELAEQNDVDLIIGSDPDADRVGIVVRNADGEYVVLSGNQTGVLLLDYIIRARKAANTMPSRPVAIKSIVTTDMARVVAEKQGVKMYDTFTGFKFMAELIGELEKTTKEHFILAYEESFGYLIGDHARDKDAVTASMLIAEMATWYHEQGMTLFDALKALYRTYGNYKEVTLNIVMTGLDGLKKMNDLMEKLRHDPPQSMGGVRVVAMRDYKSGERYEMMGGRNITKLNISGSNVLYFEMEDKTIYIVRPSGTEPKMKVYILVSGRTHAECDSKIEHYRSYSKMVFR